MATEDSDDTVRANREADEILKEYAKSLRDVGVAQRLFTQNPSIESVEEFHAAIDRVSEMRRNIEQIRLLVATSSRVEDAADEVIRELLHRMAKKFTVTKPPTETGDE